MTRTRQDDLAALDALGDRRERTLLARLRDARATVVERLCSRDEQQQRVDNLLTEIARIDAWRTTASAELTVANIRQATERRRWLLFDLGKERFYLDEAQEELDQAETEAEAVRREWQHLRERRRALASLAADDRRSARRVADRREESSVDDRQRVEVH